MFDGDVQRYNNLDEVMDNTLIIKKLLEGTLENLEIPHNVKNLSRYVVSNLKLKSVVIHKGVVELNGGLQNMQTLKYAKVLSSDLSTSSSMNNGYGIFKTVNAQGCLIEFIGVTQIPDRACYNCGLNELTLEEGLISIGNYAFASCPNLVGDFSLPESVEYIGDNAFSSNVFSTIKLGNNVKSIGDYAFNNSRKLYSINIPTSLESISLQMLAGCPLISNINIPPCVKSIGNQAFMSTGLVSVYIPDTVESLGVGLFQNCTKLSECRLPLGIESIPADTFMDCTFLREFNIPKTVITIGNSAFYDSGIKSITIPDSVTHIGERAFYSVNIESIVIPDSVTNMDGYVFQDCTSLTSVTIGSGLSKIGIWTFSRCSALTGLTIPSNITDIGSYAFNGSGIQSITIPDTVTTLGTQIFGNCNSLSSVVIGSGITSIPSSCFYYCRALKEITLPEQIVSISSYAFNYSGLTSLKLKSSTPPVLGSINALPYLNSGFTVYVPKGSLSAYQSASNWSNSNIVNKIVEYEEEVV